MRSRSTSRARPRRSRAASALTSGLAAAHEAAAIEPGEKAVEHQLLLERLVAGEAVDRHVDLAAGELGDRSGEAAGGVAAAELVGDRPQRGGAAGTHRERRG